MTQQTLETAEEIAAAKAATPGEVSTDGLEQAATALVAQVQAAQIATRGAAPIAEANPNEGPKAFKYSLPELKQIGEIMYASGMFRDLQRVQQAMVKLLAGAELGYGPFQSLRAFHSIEGKPVETSGEVTARIQRAADKYRMRSYFIVEGGERHDPIRMKSALVYGCVVIISVKEGRKWVDCEPSVFTRDDAATAGLANKDVWKKYFRNMAFARALTNAARYYCADIFGGPIYTPEELGANVDFDADGEMKIANTALPPASDAPDRTVDTDQTRAQGVAHVTRYASNRKISDAHRHEIAQAFFGRASSKELTTAELRKLYELLLGYVKQRDAVTGENLAWDADAFAGWLQIQIETAKQSVAGVGVAHEDTGEPAE